MRVAMILGTFPSPSQTFILNQIRGVVERGHEVDIFADAADPLAIEVPDCAPAELIRRTHYVRGPGRWPSPILLAESIGAILERAPFDIVHCQFGVHGRRYAWLRRMGVCRRFVTSFRGHDISRYLTVKGPNAYRDLFRIGDLFLPNCRAFYDRLRESGCPLNKLTILASGIDLRRFPLAPRTAPVAGPIVITSSGRLVEKKGFDLGIRAVAEVLAGLPRGAISYRIAGQGPLMGELARLVATLGVADHVQLLGWRRPDQIAQLLAESHLFLAPNVVAVDGDEDGIPNVLKEAMASGLPVLASRVGGVDELVEDGVSGYLVPANDIEQLQARLRQLVHEPPRWSSMGREGSQRVAQLFDMDRLNDDLIELYRRSLQQPA